MEDRSALRLDFKVSKQNRHVVGSDEHLPHVDDVRLPGVSNVPRSKHETAYMAQVLEDLVLNLEAVYLAQQLDRVCSSSAAGCSLH